MKDSEIIQHLSTDRFSKAARGLYSFFPGIRKYILGNQGSKDEAEDVFQDALLIVYKKIRANELQLSSSLKTYVFGIAKNLWMQELRRKQKTISIDFEIEMDSEIEQFESQYRVAESAFSMLGNKCQELLLLFYYKKLDMKAIASKLDFSNEKVAKNQKYRCLEKAKLNYQSLLNL